MKKYIYITGILSANLIFLGSIFKVQHWPGAHLLLIAGIIALTGFFLPLALYNTYRNGNKKYKMSYIVAYISFSVLFVSALFKMLHWFGADWLITIGIPLPMILFLPVYLYQTRKDKKYSLNHFMGIMFGLVLLAIMSSMISINLGYNTLKEFELQYNSNQELVDYIYVDKHSHKSDVDVQANRVCASIKAIKKNILQETENPIDSTYQQDLIKLNSSRHIQDVLSIKKGGNLDELKQEIIAFQQVIEQSGNNKLSNLCKEILSVKDVQKESSTQRPFYVSWENYHFKQVNLVVTLDYLTRLERNIRFIQSEAAEH